MKKLLYYTSIFVGTILICLTALYITAIIPKDLIKENSIESAEILSSQKELVHKLDESKCYTAIDNYADSILLNIVYCLEKEAPLTSMLDAEYYEGVNENAIESYRQNVLKDLEPNKSYSRYWHGSIIFLKPLLIIMNLNEIHIFSGICMAILFGVLEFLLIKKKQIILAISLAIGFAVNSIWIVPFCLEYTPIFILMLAFSILVLLIKEEYIGTLFFVSGLLTCFFDFLTTETITFTIPALILFCIAYDKEKFKNFRDGFTYLIKMGILWTSAYFSMWIAKWSITSIVLKRSVFEEAIKKAAVRISDSGISSSAGEVIKANRFFGNLISLIPVYKTTTYGEVILLLGGIGFLIFCFIYLYGKKIENYSSFKVLILLMIIPYIRYLILNNHSTLHAGFTFRAQIITISAAVYMILRKVDYKLIKKDLKKLKKIF